MDVAFAFDENYAEPAQVAAESVLAAHESRCHVTLWVMTTHAVWRQRAAGWRRQVAGRGSVNFIEAPEAFRMLPLQQDSRLVYISTGMYLRLFIPEALPPDLDRFLYLDIDTMCVADLRPLWALPSGPHLLAAVRDLYTKTIGHGWGVPGAEGRLDPAAPYFNSGVLLVNAPLWREQKVTERCLDYLAQHRTRLRFPDQDALNLVNYGQWLRLPRQWNYMGSHVLEPTDESQPNDEDARILHFTGKPKPWESDFPAGVRLNRYTELARRCRP
jgi:UDP-D-galactose:(glucosyl)LPS alpha-1,3-D-galactosyltransferase